MRPVRKPRHWWKGMPNDVPGREAERRSPVSSRRSESKRSEGPRPVGLCLLSSTLVKIFFQFPLCFLGSSLSLSLPPSFMLHHSLLRPCDKFSIQSRSFAGSRKRSTYPVGLTNIYKSRGEIFIISSDCKQNSYCIPSSS